jgi:hypothetical protein
MVAVSAGWCTRRSQRVISGRRLSLLCGSPVLPWRGCQKAETDVMTNRARRCNNIRTRHPAARRQRVLGVSGSGAVVLAQRVAVPGRCGRATVVVKVQEQRTLGVWRYATIRRTGLKWRADYGSPSLQRDVDSSAGCRHEQIGGNDAAVMRLQGCTSYRRCSAADGAVSEQEAARDAKSRSLRDAYCVRLHARRGGTLCPAALPAQLSGRLGWGLPRRCHSLADPWC